MIGKTRRGRISLALALLVGLTACSAQYRNHGYTPLEEDLAQIVVGVDTRGSVEETVGRPSSTGILSDSAWYYVSSRVRHFGPFKPKEVEREVVAISFDNRDVVRNIERFGLERGRVVTLSRRVTEPAVRDVTLIQQLLRNFGRIDLGDTFGGDG